MKVGVGYSAEMDSQAAATAAVEQAMSTSGLPVLTLLLTTDRYDQQAVFEAVKSRIEGSKLVGFCCAGVITPDVVLTQGVGVCTLSGDELKAVTAIRSGLSKNPRAVGQQAAEELLASGIDQGTVFVFPDGFGANIAETVRGLYERMGPDFHYIGGGAGDNLRFFKTYQFTEDGPQSDSLAVCLLDGLTVKTAIGHGWRPTGEPMVIGETDGKKLIEMDGKCAFDACCDRLGEITREAFPEYGMKHPLGFPDISGNYLIRDPLSVNEDKSITFVTEIPRNAVGYIMEGKTDDLIAMAGQVAAKAVEGVAQPQFALCFDCISRYLLMGERFSEEMASVRVALGEKTPLLGALTFGEIGSYADLPHFHNKTMAILVGGGAHASADG